MKCDHPWRDEILRRSLALIIGFFVPFSFTPQLKADALKLSIWGNVGGYTTYQTADVSAGFNGLTITLPSQALVKGYDSSGHENYTPMVAPYGDTASILTGLPFSLTATLYDSTRSIAQIVFNRDTPGGPIVDSFERDPRWSTILGSPNYLFPGATVDSIPSWFTGISVSTTLSTGWNIPVLTYTPSIVVSAGTPIPPLDSPVPEPAMYLVFSSAVIAAGLSRRLRR
jgi:hypothetical protein